MTDEYRARMNAERKDLADKIDRLKLFIGGSRYNGLPRHERTLLKEQLIMMEKYLRVLDQRIECFPKPIVLEIEQNEVSGSRLLKDGRTICWTVCP